MTNTIISYAKKLYDDYRGDAPSPESFELIQKNLTEIMKTHEEYLK